MHNVNLTANELRNKLAEYYSRSSFLTVLNDEQTELLEGVEPEIHNNTNAISLMVLAPENTDHAVLCAVYDNLGKGASGAAVQNLEIMLGLPESDGLVSAAL
jgi:N-acetyl-gamma-glutamyl-phosphate reductase